MGLNLDDLTVNNNAQENRFEIDLGDGVAILEYMIAGTNIIYSHTEVPVAYEGQGLASKLAHHAMEYAKTNGLKVQALCPYVAGYVQRHPEYKSITWGM